MHWFLKKEKKEGRGHAVLFAPRCTAKVYHLGKIIITSAGVAKLERRHEKWAIWGRASSGEDLFESRCKNISAVMLALKMFLKESHHVTEYYFPIFFFFFFYTFQSQ